MEVEIIKPMWFEGQPVSPGEDGQSNPVVDMPVSDATYLQGIGRVRAIVAEIPQSVVVDAAADAVVPVANAAVDDGVAPAIDAAVGDVVAVDAPAPDDAPGRTKNKNS